MDSTSEGHRAAGSRANACLQTLKYVAMWVTAHHTQSCFREGRGVEATVVILKNYLANVRPGKKKLCDGVDGVRSHDHRSLESVEEAKLETRAGGI